MEIKRKVRKIYERAIPKNDYLKYWKVVKQWAKVKYKLGTADIEMLLFLYSEGLFTQKQFEEYNEIMTWDKNRFHNLLKDKLIIVWRKRKGRDATLYELGFSGKRICASIYKKLNMEELVSENKRSNPMFSTQAVYSEKVYRNIIKKMNQEIKKNL
jgi:hypothetical protein|tara:strand:+ start:1267 stop:1734 length:468 start_codon:yes stop_codon:yes gene_type:complete